MFKQYYTIFFEKLFKKKEQKTEQIEEKSEKIEKKGVFIIPNLITFNL
jgi:hypothetical protein